MSYIRNEKALKAVGLRIRKLREKAGYPQQEFANMCDMELSQINRIELGKINTSVSVLFKIAEILEIRPYELLKIEE
ncbi:MAG: helix-turn-helix domain protein [Bacteroidota bacterium]|nr:helix-turn-helix domain protein [Bacteroidota bacterium]